MKRIRPIFFLALIVVVLAGLLPAQAPTGKIVGKVVDQEGLPLPGVSVEATGVRLIGKATAVTDGQGGYRLLALPPGAYTVIYSLPGFQTVTRKDIILELEKTITLDISLAPGKLEEEVTVIGQSPLIDVKSTARGATLNKQVFATLPKGRNFDSLLNTVPGVSRENLLAGTSVDGASGAENMYYVDGINTNNLVNGVSAQNVNYDFVEEVQFKSSGYNAEYGGSLGGVVNVLTRSGGNAFHGEVLAYYQDEKLTGRRQDTLNFNNANNARASYYSWNDYEGKDTWQNLEAGFNLGGYIIKDKLWFFGSVIPNHSYVNRTLDYNVQNANLIRDVQTKQTSWNAQAKLSAQVFKNLRLTASFVNGLTVVRGPGLRFNAGEVPTGLPVMPLSWNASQTTNYNALGFNYPNMSASVTADLVVSNSLLVNVRAGYFMTDQNHQLPGPESTPRYVFQMEQPYSYAPTTNDIALWPEIPSALRHGSNWSSYPLAGLSNTKKFLAEKYNANFDVSYYLNLAGEHSFKAGFQFIRQGEDVDSAAVNPMIYLAWDQTFDAYGTNYGRGKYGWYGVRNNDVTGAYGSLYQAFSNQWAIYLQDSWTIANRLTINAGVRTESEYIPNYSSDPLYADVKKPVNFRFKDKISPRLGFIYDVFGNASLKVFGSFAIYQDVMKLNMAANALGGFKWKSAYYSLDEYDYTKIGVNGYYPGTLYTILDHRSPVFDTIDPNMKPFTQREISLGLDKRLNDNLSFSARVVNKSVLWGIEDCGVYVPGIGEVYYYCNPGGSFINQKYAESRAAGLMEPGSPDMPKAKREYWGVNVGIDKRLSNHWLFGFSYTFSSLRGNYSGLANADEQGRNSPNGERAFDLWHFSFDKSLNPIDGVLPTDRPHFFKLYGSYVFPFGLTVGTVMQAMSGVPLTEVWNVDGPGFFPYNRANLGRTPFLFTADLYAEYSLKLGRYSVLLSANISNAFNAQTATNVYTQRYRYNISPGDAALVDTNWEPAANAALHPWFMKDWTFLAPLQARLGIKFVF